MRFDLAYVVAMGVLPQPTHPVCMHRQEILAAISLVVQLKPCMYDKVRGPAQTNTTENWKTKNQTDLNFPSELAKPW